MTDHGDHTPHPRTAGPHLGRRSLTAGVTLAGTTLVAALVAAILAGADIWTDNDGQMFAVLGIVTASCLSTALILVSAFAHFNDRRAAASAKLQTLLEKLTAQVVDVQAIVAPLPDRLKALEDVVDKVPTYGEGVIHGVTLRGDAGLPERN